MSNVTAALYVGVSLVIGMLAREYARARTADRLGDPNPGRWGWLSLRPRVWIDPFGTVILPALILILWAAGLQVVPFGYAKPLPLDPSALRRHPRDVILVSVAGPIANLVLALVAAFGLRLGVAQAGFEPCRLLHVFVLTNLSLAIFHVMPIPGLDGARMLALVMPPGAREVYRNLEQYLILFIILIYFLLGAYALGIVQALTDALMRVIVGPIGC